MFNDDIYLGLLSFVVYPWSLPPCASNSPSGENSLGGKILEGERFEK
jgi:hypothetical protein